MHSCVSGIRLTRSPRLTLTNNITKLRESAQTDSFFCPPAMRNRWLSAPEPLTKGSAFGNCKPLKRLERNFFIIKLNISMLWNGNQFYNKNQSPFHQKMYRQNGHESDRVRFVYAYLFTFIRLLSYRISPCRYRCVLLPMLRLFSLP